MSFWLKALHAMGLELHHPRPRSWWRTPRTNFDYEKSVGDGLSSSVIMGVVLWIMRNFPEAPVMLERDDEPEYIHPMLDLIRRPNPFYSGVVMTMATVLSFSTSGNAYWIKIRDSQLRVKELWWIPHWMMKPAVESNSGRYIDKYIYTVDGRNYEYDIDDVIHFRFGLDPYDTRIGLGPIKSLFREIFTDDEASNWTASICRNAGIPGVIVSPTEGGMVGDQDVKEVKEYMHERFTGDRRGEPLALSGPTKIDQFGFNPQEMNLEAIRAIPESRVAAHFGVPAAVIGFMSGLKQTKVGATMKELREQAYEGCIIPMQRMIAEDLWSQLLDDFEPQPEQWEVKFNLNKVRVLQEDENAKAERTGKLYTDGIIYLDEARQTEGYETNPSERVRRVPFNVIEVPEGQPTLAPIAQQQNMRKFLKADKPDWVDKFLQRREKDRRKLEAIFIKSLESNFNDLGKRIADKYLEVMENRRLAGKNGNTKQQNPEDIVIGELTMQDIQIDPNGTLGYEVHYLRTASQTVDSLNALFDLGVNLDSPIESKVLHEAGKRQGLIDLTAQSKKALFDSLTIGRELGEGPFQLATRIEEQVAAGPWSSSKVRSEVIARTETKYAQNVSSIEVYKEADTIGAVQVLDALLGETDEYCMMIDGAIVSFEDAQVLMAEEHPNGTRDFAPIFGKPESYDAIYPEKRRGTNAASKTE